MSKSRNALTTFGQLLIVTLFGLPLVTPLMRWTAVPCTHDGHLHVHRVAAMRHAWESGIFFTRWLPDLALGYGYPFFVYREPTPLYAVLMPHLLGFPLPAASNLFYALCILAAGWYMFLWVKDVSGTRAGLVSSIAYMSAPYLLLDALIRGNAPESLALPLFPLLLWAGRRWIIRGSIWPFLLSVFGLAFLSLSHNISTLIFVPVYFLYLIAVGWLQKIDWRPLIGRLLLLFGLGLGMTVFYTGGALLEMDQVTLSQSTTTRNNDFHYNFASIAEILASPAAEDLNLLNPPLPIRLGWVPVTLGLIGLSTLLWKKPGREQRWHVTLMGAAAVLFLFMALSISLLLWEKIPLIDFVQFPWRFIGRAALPVAFLAGAPFAQTRVERSKAARNRGTTLSNLALLAAVTLLILEALPNLYPRTCQENSFPTIVDVHAYEVATGLVGVDPEGSYFPRTVVKRPKDSPLVEEYQAGQEPQRFDMSLLPDGATAEVEYEPLSADVQINSPSPFTARYLSFAFPGWVAEVDGQRVSIVPGDPDGFITFDVPAGEHFVTIHWQSTLLRTTLLLISFLALLGVVVTAVLLARHPQFDTLATSNQVEEPLPVWPLVILGIFLLLFKILLVDNGQTPWWKTSSPPVTAPAAMTAGELGFEGYNISDTAVGSGEIFDIDLAWRLLAPTDSRYQSNIWLADADGILWSDKDTERPRIYEDAPPTWEWDVNQWAWDSREIAVLPGTPPGQYDIVMTLFEWDSQQSLTLLDEQGTVIGPTAVIGQITVDQPDDDLLSAPQFISGEIVPETGLVLTGYNMGLEVMAPGDELLLTMFWERGTDSAAGSFDLQLVSSAGEVIQSWQLPIARADFDLSTWEPGQSLRGQHILRLDAGVDSGAYDFILQDSIPLGQIEVTAPERLFEQPKIETVIGEQFGDKINLIGYSLTQEPFTVELVWSAADEIDTGYHVFVHLVDDNGNIAVQSDGQPAGWTRPTTGWAPGEYIIDTHVLPVPEEIPTTNLTLRVGMYDPETGERLHAAGSDFAVLPPQ